MVVHFRTTWSMLEKFDLGQNLVTSLGIWNGGSTFYQ
jgi:hypothetical protein